MPYGPSQGRHRRHVQQRSTKGRAQCQDFHSEPIKMQLCQNVQWRRTAARAGQGNLFKLLCKTEC